MQQVENALNRFEAQYAFAQGVYVLLQCTWCDAKLFMAYTWNVSQRNLQSLNLRKAHDVQLHSHEVIEYFLI